MNKCAYCGKKTKNVKYCCSSCAGKVNSKNRIRTVESKLKTSTALKAYFQIHPRRRANKVSFLGTNRVRKPGKSFSCFICGQQRCERRLCSQIKHGMIRNLTKYWGFDKETLGTPQALIEINKIKDLIYDEYCVSKKSLMLICKERGARWWVPVKNLLKLFDIPRRTWAEAGRLAYKVGRASQHSTPIYPYKQTWHTTWNNKQVFLRSSYELRIAKKLDEQKINYEVESLRIPYIAADGIERIYIPDFFIPNKNKIIEVKSKYTLNSNTILKVKAAEKQGYQVEVINLDVKDASTILVRI